MHFEITVAISRTPRGYRAVTNFNETDISLSNQRNTWLKMLQNKKKIGTKYATMMAKFQFKSLTLLVCLPRNLLTSFPHIRDLYELHLM